ncbi:MAG TPA: hypothetical protein VNJ01_05720 [Bacteriovoracaceae bacterium]|nr:hypothetical protein [Bacteriovoracaceae bacterium]
MRSLEAVCVSSTEVSRRQITYDEVTGLIVRVGDLGIPRAELDFTYGDECRLFAGMGDIHIHAREDVSGKNNYKEDFTTARAAMHNGGLTHAGDMPNNPVPPVDEHSYHEKFQLAALKAQGELWLYAGIGPGTRPLPYPVPYKVYMGPSVGELFFKDLASLETVLAHYQGQEVSFHCEDPLVLEETKQEKTHQQRRPARAEVVATKDALYLIEKFKLKGKLCHYSTREGLALVLAARKKGVDVKLEVTPQHLYFELEQLGPGDDKKFQMNPPIRSGEDRRALLMAVKNGDIDFLATDHAPHTQQEKDSGISGLTGLDTYGPFVCWLLKQGVDPKTVALMASENPGTFHNKFLASWHKLSSEFGPRGKGLGFVVPGYCANFTVLDLEATTLVSPGKLCTKVGHSPFLGHTLPGAVKALFIKGREL